jgi:hypothetical protein
MNTLTCQLNGKNLIVKYSFHKGGYNEILGQYYPDEVLIEEITEGEVVYTEVECHFSEIELEELERKCLENNKRDISNT